MALNQPYDPDFPFWILPLRWINGRKGFFALIICLSNSARGSWKYFSLAGTGIHSFKVSPNDKPRTGVSQRKAVFACDKQRRQGEDIFLKTMPLQEVVCHGFCSKSWWNVQYIERGRGMSLSPWAIFMLKNMSVVLLGEKKSNE